MNHFYDDVADRTRCGDYRGPSAFHVSCNDRVSCPDCRKLLTAQEREGQWYPFDEEPDA